MTAGRAGLVIVLVLLGSSIALGQPPLDDSRTPVDESPDSTTGSPTEKPRAAVDDPPALDPRWKLRRLSRNGSVWVDLKNKLVVVAGSVTLRKGPLEMFACPQGTKDYESIVAVRATAFEVHAALLAIGIVPGRPVHFYPSYERVSGPVIEVEVFWQDKGALQRARAQDWVRHVQSGQSMSYDWVFGGSAFWTDEKTGERYYMADGGELICVSNFASATLDVPVASPQQNESLWFEPYTERIPPRRTEVFLVLREKPRELRRE
ncbi:MAG TPA: YdjY domain-containing protein [Pirellulaceae bacterium]